MQDVIGAVVILLIAVPVMVAWYVGAAILREFRKTRKPGGTIRGKRGEQ